MPARPPHPCTRPGCGNLVPHGQQCPNHERDANRPNAYQRGYTTRRWRVIRKRFLATHNQCVDCGAPATVPDHDPYERRELIAMGVPDPDAFEYLKPRCIPCHNKRTARATPGGWNRNRENSRTK